MTVLFGTGVDYVQGFFLAAPRRDELRLLLSDRGSGCRLHG